MKHHHHPVTLLVVVLAAAVLAPSATFVTADEVPVESSETEIVAYYFHGNMRCATCRKLEAYSKEAITEGFAEELASGQLAWRVVNTDEKENAHFVKDFELVTKSLVLAEIRNGEVVRFENLKLIWQLVRDQDGFLKYVRDSTRDFMEKS